MPIRVSYLPQVRRAALEHLLVTAAGKYVEKDYSGQLRDLGYMHTTVKVSSPQDLEGQEARSAFWSSVRPYTPINLLFKYSYLPTAGVSDTSPAIRSATAASKDVRR